MKNINKKLLVLLLVFTLISAWSSGCKASIKKTETVKTKQVVEKTKYPLTITDDLGKKKTIAQEPKRIVSLAPSNTEIVFALGQGDKVVGVSNLDDYPKEVGRIKKVGDAFNVNVETIVAARPDLVLAISGGDWTNKLEQQDIVVIVISPQRLEDVYDSIIMLGQVLNDQKEAGSLVEELQAKIDGVAERISTLSEEEKVTVYLESDPTPWTIGPGSFIDDIVAKAGGENVFSDLKEAYAQVSMEDIINKDPDVIIITEPDVMESDVSNRPGWSQIQAVKESRVLTTAEIDPDLISRPGPRMANGVEQLARLLYPELFK